MLRVELEDEESERAALGSSVAFFRGQVALLQEDQMRRDHKRAGARKAASTIDHATLQHELRKLPSLTSAHLAQPADTMCDRARAGTLQRQLVYPVPPQPDKASMGSPDPSLWAEFLADRTDTALSVARP